MRTGVLFFLVLLLLGCQRELHLDYGAVPTNCAHDTFTCPDGSVALRSGEKCEFACPDDPTAPCDYAAAGTRYIADSPDACARQANTCSPNETYFYNHCGCGCVT